MFKMDQCYLSQSLSRLIIDCTTMEHLPHDQNLVSVLRGASILPLSAFVKHTKFLRFSPSITDIVLACENSGFLRNRIVYCPDPCLVLPFFVDPTVLIIDKVKDTKLNDFRKYVSIILGHGYFEVHPYSPNGSYKTRFADVSTAISFWRALKYFPINGGFVQCVPISSPSPFPEKGKLTPIPQRKKKVNRTERKRRNRMKTKKAHDESMPAALPMATCLTGMNQMPQAVLIESQIRSISP